MVAHCCLLALACNSTLACTGQACIDGRAQRRQVCSGQTTKQPRHRTTEIVRGASETQDNRNCARCLLTDEATRAANAVPGAQVRPRTHRPGRGQDLVGREVTAAVAEGALPVHGQSTLPTDWREGQTTFSQPKENHLNVKWLTLISRSADGNRAGRG